MRASTVPIWLGLSALTLLGAVSAAAWFALNHAPSETVPRIGFLSPTAPGKPPERAFMDTLRSLGYVPGKNIVIESRYANGHDERLPALAAELVRDKVQVIVAMNPSPALAAQKATHTIPIVFASISDPLGMGLVQSLARPGGNITGVANAPLDLNRKLIEVLKDALPGLRKVAILARAGNPNSQLHLAGEVAAARQLDIEARIYDVAGPQDFDAAFTAMKRDGMRAVVQIQDSVFSATRMTLMNDAVKHGLPVIAGVLEYADSKVLLIYGTRFKTSYERAAVYVDKILKGTKPADLPVDQPLNIKLIINLKVARELGIELPRSMLIRANQVIE